MSRHVLQITADGTITGLYTEALPLAELGEMSMQRASTVEWSAKWQLWEIRIDGQIEYAHESRAACLAWESEFFNLQLERT